MNAKERWCLASLDGSCVDAEYLAEVHGIPWPPDEQFELDFSAWIASTRAKPCGDGKPNRYAFEMFLQSQRLMTRKYSAARLGMQSECLDQLLPKLPEIGLSKKYAVYRGIIDESLSEDLVRSLPGLRFRTFGTHDSFCELLHGALDGLALDLKILPLFCATADQLGEQRMYASTWDNITLLPLSVKHSVWLDFKKPLALAPDRCSKLFLAQNYDELRPHLAGREEPRDFRQYIDFRAEVGVSWDGPTSFAYGVDAFLARLSPHGQAEGQKAFPDRVDRALVRFQGPETIKQWFDRCVKVFMPEGLDSWRLEGNLAAFAIVSWKPTNELDFVTINVLKTECSLQDYLDLKEEDFKLKEWQEFSQPRYLRLDLDYGTLGPIGTHPLPHIHTSPHDTPRCTLDASRSTNVVVDFMEFVYRHFFPQAWLSWAERTWNRHYHDKKRDPGRNPFRAIVSGFAENQIGVLHTLTKDISKLVAVLAEEKARLFELRMNGADRRMMTFPDWHG